MTILLLAKDLEQTPATPSQAMVGTGIALISQEASQEGRRLILTKQIPTQLFGHFKAAAIRRARVEAKGGGLWYATIPNFQGVWASQDSAKGALEELEEVLHDWLLVKIQEGDRDIPVIDEIDLNVL